MKPIEEIFWAKIEKSDDGHWHWLGRKTKDGHGHLNIYLASGKKKHTTAARVSWEIHHGSIPKGANVCHSCEFKDCVNPEHLHLCALVYQKLNGQA